MTKLSGNLYGPGSENTADRIRNLIPLAAGLISWSVFIPVAFTPNNILYENHIDMLCVILGCCLLSFIGFICCYFLKGASSSHRKISFVAALSFPGVMVAGLLALFCMAYFSGVTA